MKALIPAALFVLLVSLGCAKEPAGPAERIGKGIDEIMKGLEEMDSRSQGAHADTEADQKARRNSGSENAQPHSPSDHYADQTSL